MKRAELLKYLKENGCEPTLEGANHTHIKNSNTGQLSSVPRHDEIKNPTAWKICKDLNVPKPRFR